MSIRDGNVVLEPGSVFFASVAGDTLVTLVSERRNENELQLWKQVDGRIELTQTLPLANRRLASRERLLNDGKAIYFTLTEPKVALSFSVQMGLRKERAS